MSVVKDLYNLISNKIKVSADRSKIESIGINNKLKYIKERQDYINKFYSSKTKDSISGFAVVKDGNIFVDPVINHDIVDTNNRGITKHNPSLKGGIDRLCTLVVEEGVRGKIIGRYSKKSVVLEKQLGFLNNLWLEFTEESDFVDDSSFEHIQFLAFREVAMNGECFIVRKLKAYKSKKENHEKFKLKIQIFSKYSLWNELTFINTSNPENTIPKELNGSNFEVDFEKTKTMNKEGRLTAGNFTRNGIVYSPDYQPIAYLFKNTTNGFNTDGRFLEIPANEVAHVYFFKEANKRRGIPFIEGGGYVLKYADDFFKSTLEKNNLASKFAFGIEKNLDDQQSLDRYASTFSQPSGFSAREAFAQSAAGILENDAEAAAIDYNNDYARQIALDLKPGQKLTQFHAPDNKDFVEIMKSMNQYVANALGIPYELVSGDWSQLNYSGGKAVFEIFKKQIYVYQKHIIISKICKPVSNWFLEWAEDALDTKVFNKQEIFPKFKWTSPILGSLDPVKDAEATIAKIQSGLMSPSLAVAEEGRDWEDTLQDIKKDKMALDSIGVHLYELKKNPLRTDDYLEKDTKR